MQTLRYVVLKDDASIAVFLMLADAQEFLSHLQFDHGDEGYAIVELPA